MLFVGTNGTGLASEGTGEVDADLEVVSPWQSSVEGFALYTLRRELFFSKG